MKRVTTWLNAWANNVLMFHKVGTNYRNSSKQVSLNSMIHIKNFSTFDSLSSAHL